MTTADRPNVKKKRVTPPKTFRHAPDAPEAVQAVQIALLTMKAAKVQRWSELAEQPVADLNQKVNLTPEQQGLLEKYAHLLGYVQLGPMVTFAGCDTCGRHGLAAQANVAARCGFTLGCPGKVVKASSMPYRAPSPKAPVATEPEPDTGAPGDDPDTQAPVEEPSAHAGDFLDSLFFGTESPET